MGKLLSKEQPFLRGKPPVLMANYRTFGQLGRGDYGSAEPYNPPIFPSTEDAIARHVDAGPQFTVDMAVHRHAQGPHLSEYLRGKRTLSGYFPQGHPAGHMTPPSHRLQRTQCPAFESRLPIGLSRPNEEFLHRQNFPRSDGNSGQEEALGWKRARIDGSGSGDLPVYPQRPGQKDCAHYMATRTCKFGAACRFDHPDWVPAGGIPDWNAVPAFPSGGGPHPQRPGEPDCPFYMHTGTCKFGSRCKFSHPKDRPEAQKAEGIDGSGDKSLLSNGDSLPERPGEPECAFFLRTGNCRFGANCKFSHPEDRLEGSTEAGKAGNFMPAKPAAMQNSKGLPIRPGEIDCPFFIKTGSCKYGQICRFSHPCGAKLSLAGLPRRDGVAACPFYMNTGTCKFGENCKFDHPPPMEAVARVVAEINTTDAVGSDDETS